MGLDMYMLKHKPTSNFDTVKAMLESRNSDKEELLGTWRKHNRLHGAMKELWLKKTGQNDDADDLFNCRRVYLSVEDLDQLETDIRNKNLPYCSGFFFGIDSYEWPKGEQEKENELTFEVFAKARKALAKGELVYYNSWW